MELVKVIDQTVLDLHGKWKRGEPGGKKLVTAAGRIEIRVSLRGADLIGANLSDANLSRADLIGANLIGANLRRADLIGADLSDANLSRADLSDANLSRADLIGANLRDANLRDADLRDANLSGADLSDANLSRANLIGANLIGANLSGADLREAKNAEWAAALTCIVPEGDIIGYKKLANGAIAKLLIPADAPRSNASGRKCRCAFANVLEITLHDVAIDSAASCYDSRLIYRVGERVTANGFDSDRFNECSTGIHFFITRVEAERYEFL